MWFSNVPHTRLVEDKGGQNWISRDPKDKSKFKFPGGGTQFIHGADQYLDQISKVDHFLEVVVLASRHLSVNLLDMMLNSDCASADGF